MIVDRVLENLPAKARSKVEQVLEVIDVASEIRNPKVMMAMAPSAARGFILQKAKRGGDSVQIKAHHSATFDLQYRHDFPEMASLYRKAVAQQWDATKQLDWDINVDPENPETPVLPANMIDFERLSDYGVHMTPAEQSKARHAQAAWMLSQFLHGEQGALFAAAQVVESVQWLDGKLYGATQVMDEGRHVEVFQRYLDDKLQKRYPINDNLFVIIDDLMTDSRWDMKFLGMQIMIEGLALGAFGYMYKGTREPLLKELLKYVIKDEARHVHYGVLALQQYYTRDLSDKERREREDWAFEVALLMRNRFLSHETYEEFYAHKMTRRQWNEYILNSASMREFRTIMFKRLVPNLQFIGLLTPRMERHYEKAGLMQFIHEKNASEITGEEMVGDLA